MTYDPPYWPHLNIALPAIALLAAQGGTQMVTMVAPWMGRHGWKLANGILAGAIILTGIFNWQVYYGFVDDNANLDIRISRYLNSLNPGYQVYLLNENHEWGNYTFKFFNRHISGQDLTMQNLKHSPPKIQQPTIFIVYNQPELIPELQTVFPGGVVQEHRNTADVLAFHSYKIDPPGSVFPATTSSRNPFTLPGWYLIFASLGLTAGLTCFKTWRQHHTLAM